jgi:hypothetical protein
VNKNSNLNILKDEDGFYLRPSSLASFADTQKVNQQNKKFT